MLTSSSPSFLDGEPHLGNVAGEGEPHSANGTNEAPIWNLEILAVAPGEDVTDATHYAEDDVKGGALPVELVREARRREVGYLQDRDVYEYATVSKCWEMTGRRPLSLKWIDTDKGGKLDPNVRSRLVCTEVRRKGTEAVFSATPPLESMRILIAKLSSVDPRGLEDPLCATLADVSRAHFYATAVRDVFIQLPAEDARAGEAGLCGKLRKTMYGTLDASNRWSEHYTGVLTRGGFQAGKASPCHFWHPDRDAWVLVHGDDFFIVGRAAAREYVLKLLRAEYELKTDTLGPLEGQLKELKVLGRVISYTADGYLLEGDASLVEAIVDRLNLGKAKSVITPGAAEESKVTAAALQQRRLLGGNLEAARDYIMQGGGDEEDEELLTGSEAKGYQGVAALVNYVAQDRPDLLFCAKEAMRSMSAPTREAETRIKRIGRFLKDSPRMASLYRWRPIDLLINVFVDANWAGCIKSRRSTLGGATFWNGQFIKAWSRTMHVLALSTAESELAAVVKGATEGLGAQAILSDFGLKASVRLSSDATAAIGIAKRLGLGRVRHLATADLWIQQRIRMGELDIRKWPGTENCADLMTKIKGRQDLDRFMKDMNFVALAGRSPATPMRTNGWTINMATSRLCH